jgi:hypothetical protein
MAPTMMSCQNGWAPRMMSPLLSTTGTKTAIVVPAAVPTPPSSEFGLSAWRVRIALEAANLYGRPDG